MKALITYETFSNIQAVLLVYETYAMHVYS